MSPSGVYSYAGTMNRDSEIVLDINEPSALALTIWWDRLGNASLSNPDAQVPSDMIINAVQFSTDVDFSTYVEETVDNSASSVQFTAAELNTIMTELGLEGGVASTVYIRMSTSLGTNTEPVYGESIEITVTPYFVDMSFIRLLQQNGRARELSEVSLTLRNGKNAATNLAPIDIQRIA